MFWQIHRLGKKISHTKSLNFCDRCGLYYEPVLPDECPRCTGLSDDEVERIIQKRSKTGLTIGRLMLIGSLVVVVLLLLVNMVV